jgi:hypothetical protein
VEVEEGEIIIDFCVKYSEWVSKLVLIHKMNGYIWLCVDFHTLNKERVKDNLMLPNMELILQQVVGSQMMSLLDGFLGYDQIHLKWEDHYKTTLTT